MSCRSGGRHFLDGKSVVTGVIVKFLAETGTGARNSRPDGAQRNHQLVGDFLVTKSIQITHQERRAEVVRKLINRSTYPISEQIEAWFITFFDALLFLLDVPGSGRSQRLSDIDIFMKRPTCAETTQIDEAILADPEQPGAAIGTLFEGSETTQGSQQRVLKQIFGTGGLSRQRHCKRSHRTEMG